MIDTGDDRFGLDPELDYEHEATMDPSIVIDDDQYVPPPRNMWDRLGYGFILLLSVLVTVGGIALTLVHAGRTEKSSSPTTSVSPR